MFRYTDQTVQAEDLRVVTSIKGRQSIHAELHMSLGLVTSRRVSLYLNLDLFQKSLSSQSVEVISRQRRLIMQYGSTTHKI